MKIKATKATALVLEALRPLLDDVKQHQPDLFEIDRMDYPVELSPTVGEMRNLINALRYFEGFDEMAKAYGFDIVSSLERDRRRGELDPSPSPGRAE